MKRGDGKRPNDTVGVMILLDGGGDQPANPDPVTSHFDGSLTAFSVEISRAHGLAVLPSQIENLSHFNASITFQRAAIAAGTGIAGYGQAQIGKSGWREVPFLIDIHIMGVRLVGTRDRSLDSLNGEVRDDSELKPDGPQKSRNSSRGVLHFGFIRQSDLATTQRR